MTPVVHHRYLLRRHMCLNGEQGQVSRVREAVNALASVVAILGLLSFAVLRLYYNRFYGALGVDPSSVGLTYSTTLVSSLGVLLFLVISSVLAPIAIISGVYLVCRVIKSEESESYAAIASIALGGLAAWLPKATRSIVPYSIGIGLVVTTGFLWCKAEMYADAVMNGKPIRFGNILLTSFAVRATPVNVTLVGNLGELGSGDLNLGHELLYLGQTSENLVLYDSDVQGAIYLPQGLVVLEVVNCEIGDKADLRCKDAVS